MKISEVNAYNKCLVTSAENIYTGHYPDITEHFSSHTYRSKKSYNSRLHHFKTQNSSVSNLTGYRLMVMIQYQVQYFIIQASSRTHPTSYSKDRVVSLPGGKGAAA
jgi:hypothetical protein